MALGKRIVEVLHWYSAEYNKWDEEVEQNLAYVKDDKGFCRYVAKTDVPAELAKEFD